jgi:pilus assembly protein CpaE
MSAAPIRTLVAVDGVIDPSVVESVLDDPGIEIAGVIESAPDGVARETVLADVLLVACGEHSDEALDFIETAVRDRPERPVVVAYGGSANGFMRRAFDAGADDIVLLDETTTPGADTFFALQKAVARRTGGGPSTGHAADLGTFVCVLGPKGGIGKTLTSANLGSALAVAGHRVALVDLDLQFGDLALALGLRPERTIYDLATAGGSLDIDKVNDYLQLHESSGAHVLLAPVRPDQASSIDVDFLRELYGLLRSSFDFVVVDTPPGFTPEVITTIDAATSIVLVGMLDAPSLKNMKLGLETLELIGYPSEQVRLLLNRADTSVGITHADVVAILGRAPDVLVPSQRDVVRSINAGEPIVLTARRSEPGKAFAALAELYVQARAPKPVTAGRGLRLLRRS